MLRDISLTPGLVLRTALLVLAVMHAASAGSALAQSAPLLGESMDTVAPVVHESRGGPFSVQSSGRPARRPPRSVVVLPDTVVGRSPAAAPSAPPAAAPAAPRGATTSPPPPRAAGAAPRRTHVVVSGDTLFGIARRYGVTAEAIRLANQLGETVIRIGQTLVIPPEERP